MEVEMMTEEMENPNLLLLVKANLGIKTNVRDQMLNPIISGVITELAGKGIVSVDESDPDYEMLVVDYAAWQYRSRGEGAMPRNIQYRIRNRKMKGLSDDG